MRWAASGGGGGGVSDVASLGGGELEEELLEVGLLAADDSLPLPLVLVHAASTRQLTANRAAIGSTDRRRLIIWSSLRKAQ